MSNATDGKWKTLFDEMKPRGEGGVTDAQIRALYALHRENHGDKPDSETIAAFRRIFNAETAEEYLVGRGFDPANYAERKLVAA